MRLKPRNRSKAAEAATGSTPRMNAGACASLSGQYEAEIQQEYEQLLGGRREKSIAEIALEKCGFYLPDDARYDYLLAKKISLRH
jgi:hypothetical protein